MKMKIDMHCHVLGNGKDIHNTLNDIYFNSMDNPLGSFDARKLLVKYVVPGVIGSFLNKQGGKVVKDEISTDDYFTLLKTLLAESKEIDALVLLAMDGIYDPIGSPEPMERETELLVSNRFLYNKIRAMNREFESSGDENVRKKRFLFGASVSPNRRDWEEELHYVCTETDAVLLKWVPSAMHIEVWNNRHRRFYEMMKEYALPLLCHIGPEYAFIEGVSKRHLDYFKYLDTPLSYDVKVMAAHCGAPYFPTDKNELDDFIEFITQSNSGTEVKLWADTSALTAATRMALLPKILKGFRPEWLLNGSDFPVPVSGVEHIPFITHNMTIDEYKDILETKNPFDLDVKIKRAHGFSDSILENAGKVLRIREESIRDWETKRV